MRDANSCRNHRMRCGSSVDFPSHCIPNAAPFFKNVLETFFDEGMGDPERSPFLIRILVGLIGE